MALSCETGAGDGSIVSGALCVSGCDGIFLIFWLGNGHVHYLSFYLSKTPPSFAVVYSESQTFQSDHSVRFLSEVKSLC